MLKELINHFQAMIDSFQNDGLNLNSKQSFSKRTNYLNDVYQLPNGQEVRMEIGQKRHIAEVLEIERQSYNGKTPWGYLALENDIVRRQQTLYFVIYHEDEPIAFLGTRFEITNIHITNIAVIPAWQKQGIGSLLLALLKTVANEEAVSSISLEVRVSNKPAQHLYKKLGFQVLRIKKNYYHGDGEDAIDMKMELSS